MRAIVLAVDRNQSCAAYSRAAFMTSWPLATRTSLFARPIVFPSANGFVCRFQAGDTDDRRQHEIDFGGRRDGCDRLRARIAVPAIRPEPNWFVPGARSGDPRAADLLQLQLRLRPEFEDLPSECVDVLAGHQGKDLKTLRPLPDDVKRRGSYGPGGAQ